MRAVEKKIKTRARRVKIWISSCKMKMGMTGGDHFSYWVNFLLCFLLGKNEFSDAISTAFHAQCF